MPFSQPSIARDICQEITKRNLGRQSMVSARSIAAAVQLRHPDVPEPLLRILAAKALWLFYEPIELAEVTAGDLTAAEEDAVARFLAAHYAAEAAVLAAMS